MSHVTGTVQTVSPALTIGPSSGSAPTSPNTWLVNFAHTPAPTGTKLVILHFTNVQLPASNRLEVGLGYDMDVFTAADGADFWTRPVNVYALAGGLIPIRYITNSAATGGATLDKYGRGERHAGTQDPTSLSNCDPFQKDAVYTEPKYDPFWYCAEPPNWENVAKVPSAADVRRKVARSVGMIVSVEGNNVSTCSVTLVDVDKVITAGHCHTPTEALTSSVTFDYETDAAGARPSGYNARFHKVKASLNHQWDGTNDFSLLQLATAPAGIPAIQMRHDLPAVGEQIFGVHHPNGAVKKLSIPHPGFDLVRSSSSTEVTVPKNFHVSGGSSGSGLFDTAGRIVGVLSHGDPCHITNSFLIYYPTASILQAIAPTPPTPITRDVIVVFDRSGSMSMDDGTGRSKIEAARDAMSLFVQLVRASTGNKVGLVSFSTSASNPADFALQAVTPGSKTSLIGNAPYSGGVVGGLMPGGATSIGDGLNKAHGQFPTPGANPRAMLLLTDGLQNTPPMIVDAENAGSLNGIDLHAIGFGSESNLDGPLLNALAANHNGQYIRASSGLALEKFFSHAFGNIFAAGVLMDPEFVLPADQPKGNDLPFHVCGEDSITAVIGWDRLDASLMVEVTSPGGNTFVAGTTGTDGAAGRTWAFLRIPLPANGERDGLWRVNVVRPGGGGEFPPPTPQLRYFVNVVPEGGPKLSRLPDAKRYYTGDIFNPAVMLRYSDGGWPENVAIKLTVTRPDASVGNKLSESRLKTPTTIDADIIPARQTTLMDIESSTGKPVVNYVDSDITLFDDVRNGLTAFEPAAIFASPQNNLLLIEGNYSFHAVASYGTDCVATRELFWSIHVDVGIDPGKTVTVFVPGTTQPDGSQTGTIKITPKDVYGNNLGPGRGGDITVTGIPGTTVTGPLQDNGDGTYTIPVTVDPGGSSDPGVIIGQPGRPPVTVGGKPKKDDDRWPWWLWLLILILILLLILLILK